MVRKEIGVTMLGI